MNETLQKKYQELLSILQKEESIAVAYSGGVDSSFLLAAAKEALKDQVIAVTVCLSSVPSFEEEEAHSFCEKYGIRQIFVDLDVFKVKGYADNPKNRCYLCKKALFTKILSTARENGLKTVAEGSNADDQNEYRPGLKALKELKIKSPLNEAGLHKEEIRTLSRELGLPTWDKPSNACLATRFPYGEKLSGEKFEMVQCAEEEVKKAGFSNVRVRSHGTVARIEVMPEEFQKILEPEIRKNLLDQLHSLGFTYVTLDLKGFRSGSMDEIFPS